MTATVDADTRLEELMANLDPKALSPADLAKLLAAASGKPIREEHVRQDLAAGAPTNPDGSINLVYYAAWLAKERKRGR